MKNVVFIMYCRDGGQEGKWNKRWKESKERTVDRRPLLTVSSFLEVTLTSFTTCIIKLLRNQHFNVEYLHKLSLLFYSCSFKLQDTVE